MKVRTTIAGTAFRARLTAAVLGRPDHPGSGGRLGLRWVNFDPDCALFLADSGHRARFRRHHPLHARRDLHRDGQSRDHRDANGHRPGRHRNQLCPDRRPGHRRRGHGRIAGRAALRPRRGGDTGRCREHPLPQAVHQAPLTPGGPGPGAGAVGAAAAGADRRPGPDDHLRRVRSPGRGHGDAGGRPGPGRSAPVRLGVQRVHAGQRGRHRGGRPRGRPAGAGGSVRGRGGAVRLRAGRGGPGSLDGRAGSGPGATGPGRGGGALGGLRHHWPQPARDAATPDDGGPVHRLGRAWAGRAGHQRRGGAPVRVAVGVPGPAAGGRGGRVDRRARPDPPRAARRVAGAAAPADRRPPHRRRGGDDPGRPDPGGRVWRGAGRPCADRGRRRGRAARAAPAGPARHPDRTPRAPRHDCHAGAC